MQNPFFSILIPLYNKEKYIAYTLNSVLAQEFSDYEVIIVDDGSTDKSPEITISFLTEKVKYYHKENGGVSSARNFAMQQASGQYFAFLDADDYWYPNHLSEIYKATVKLPQIKVFASLIEVETDAGTHLPNYTGLDNSAIQEVNIFTTSYARTILSGSTAVIQRDAAKVIGDFDVSILTCEDTDYWIRTGFMFRAGIVNKITARHVFVSQSLSKKAFKMTNATFFDKFTEQEKNNNAAKKMIDLNRFSLALLCKIAGDKDSYLKLRGMISPQSLTFKQQLLLNLDRKTLVRLKKFKAFLEKKNIRLKVF